MSAADGADDTIVEHPTQTGRWTRWRRGLLLALGVNMACLSVAALSAWNDSLDYTAYLVPAGLVGTALAGVVASSRRSSRHIAVGLLLGTAASVLLQIMAVVGLVLLYARLHPGWDLS